MKIIISCSSLLNDLFQWLLANFPIDIMKYGVFKTFNLKVTNLLLKSSIEALLAASYILVEPYLKLEKVG